MPPQIFKLLSIVFLSISQHGGHWFDPAMLHPGIYKKDERLFYKTFMRKISKRLVKHRQF